MDIYFDSRLDAIEQLQHIGIEHPDTAVRRGSALHQLIRCAVDVDIAPGAVDFAVAVMAGFEAAEPEDAGQNPVALWVKAAEFGAVELAGRTAALEHGMDRFTPADFRADSMPASGRAFAAFPFAGTVLGGRDRIGFQGEAVFDQRHTLLADRNVEVKIGHSYFTKSAIDSTCPVCGNMSITPALTSL